MSSNLTETVRIVIRHYVNQDSELLESRHKQITYFISAITTVSIIMTGAKSSPVVLLLILGLLHTGRFVESFSSPLAQPKLASTTLFTSQLSIIRSGVVPLHHNTEAVTAATSKHHPFWSSSALKVATGIVEETSNVSSSGSDGGDGDDEDEDNGGLPEFGADGLWHITNEQEYK